MFASTFSHRVLLKCRIKQILIPEMSNKINFSFIFSYPTSLKENFVPLKNIPLTFSLNNLLNELCI